MARLAVRRSLAQAPLLGVIAAVLLVTAGLLAGIPRFLDASATESLRGSLAQADGTSAALQVAVRLAADAPAQDAGVRDVLAALPGHAVSVLRSIRSDRLDTEWNDTVFEAVFAADPDAEDRAEVVDGTWPAGDGELAVPADAGPEVGDTIRFGESVLTVTALWRPANPADPAWFGAADAIYATEPTLAGLDVNPFARWTVLPRLGDDGIRPTDLDALVAGIAGLDPALRAAGLAPSGVIIEGGLRDSLGTLARSAAAVRGVTPVPVVLAAVIGAVAVLQLARLLAAARTGETILLRSRGRSPQAALRDAATEGAVVAIPAGLGGAALGTVVGGGLVDGWWIAVGVAVAAAGIAALVVSAARTGDDRAARGTGAITVGALVTASAAAALAIWQLRLYGSPVITTSDGRQVVDPLASLAPALGLLAAGVAALALFTPLSLLVERTWSASTGLLGALASRQVARRVSTFAVPVLLASLAVGGATVAATYTGTWSSMNDRAGALRNGADVRVRIASPGTVGNPDRIHGAAEFSPPATEAAPVLVVDALAGDQHVSLVAIAGSSLPSVMLPLRGEVEVARIGDSIDAPSTGIPLPTGSELALTVATTTAPLVPGTPLTPAQGQLTLAAWVMDDAGSVARIDLDLVTLSGPLPVTATAGWSLIAIDLTVRAGFTPATSDFAVTGIAVDGSAVPLPAPAWAPQPAGDDLAAVSAAEGIGASFELGPGAPTVLVRLMPPSPAAAPALVTDALAARLELAVGDQVALRFAGSGRQVAVTVAGTTPLLPGSTGDWGAVADLRQVMEQLLRDSTSVPAPGDVWIAADDETATATAVAALAPDGARVTTSQSGTGSELLRPVALALVLGAVGGLALAVAAVAAAAAALERRRRPEIPVLKSAGLSAQQQARLRVGELVAVLAYAVLAGLGGGLLVSSLTVGELARSAVLDAPAQLASRLVVEPLPLLLSLGVFVLPVVVVVAGAGLRVRGLALTATGREVGP